jgi:hypothetical protein
MARHAVVEETLEEVADETVAELTVDDFFAQEVDQGEYDEVANSLVVPTGRYTTNGDFNYKLDEREVTVIDEQTGLPTKLIRRTLRYWGKVYNEDGAQFMLGLNVSPMALYGTGSGDSRVYYRKPIAGSKPDGATKNFHQAVKLYKKENGLGKEDPVAIGQIAEFLQRTPLRLENKVLPPREEGGDPVAWIAGFNLASA